MKKMKEFILREVADEYILIPTGKTTEDLMALFHSLRRLPIFTIILRRLNHLRH